VDDSARTETHDLGQTTREPAEGAIGMQQEDGMRQSVRDNWRAFNEPFEGVLDFMYLDVRGLLTTGMGNLLDTTTLNQGDAPRLPTAAEAASSHALAEKCAWIRNSDNQPATDAEIDAEWDQIRARLSQASHGGGTFKQFTTLHLEDAEVDRIINERLDSNEQQVKTRPEFGQFDNWPADAQLGVLSMAWAMGPGRFSVFPHFLSDVNLADWTGAASECRMSPDSGTLKNRNDADQLAFTNAAQVAATASGLDPDQLFWPNAAHAVVPAAPEVTGLTPSSGDEAGNTSVRISGTGFTNVTDVSFGGNSASFTVSSDSDIEATSPSGTAGDVVDVTVTTSAGTSNADQFTYIASP
jgi:GH24 family phage-related lysozyme (muramidase)